MLTGRAGAARLWLPLTLVAALAAGAALAQDAEDGGGDDGPIAVDPGVGDDGDGGYGSGDGGDDGGIWEEPAAGEDGGVVEDVPLSECDGCEAWTTGGDVEFDGPEGGRPEMENARGGVGQPAAPQAAIADRPNPRGKDGGTCSEDGFLPLPWRCSW